MRLSHLFLCFSLIVSEEPVLRDQFYDGNVKTERGEAHFLLPPGDASIVTFLRLFPGAVVLRVARSWFRIGSLEILSESGEFGLLRWVPARRVSSPGFLSLTVSACRQLTNFVIDEHFPSISSDDPDKYLVVEVTLWYFSVV